MCESNSRWSGEDIFIAIVSVFGLALFIWAFLHMITGMVEYRAIEKYKRTQQCITKHEASVQVCKDLYE